VLATFALFRLRTDRLPLVVCAASALAACVTPALWRTPAYYYGVATSVAARRALGTAVADARFRCDPRRVRSRACRRRVPRRARQVGARSRLRPRCGDDPHRAHRRLAPDV